MELRDYLLLGGFGIQTLLLGVTLFKLIWGSSADLHTQFASVTANSVSQVAAARDEWQGKFDSHTSNFADVVQNLNNRIHAIELAAANMRADTAETYMRRDSYYRATEEFKRDVKASHDDLKQDMDVGFKKIEDQVSDLNRVILGQAPLPRRGA